MGGGMLEKRYDTHVAFLTNAIAPSNCLYRAFATQEDLQSGSSPGSLTTGILYRRLKSSHEPQRIKECGGW